MTYALRPFPGNLDLSKPAATFILSYVIGMLARYFPSRWETISRGGPGDVAMPTLLAAISFIELRFPEMIADLLESRQGNPLKQPARQGEDT